MTVKAIWKDGRMTITGTAGDERMDGMFCFEEKELHCLESEQYLGTKQVAIFISCPHAGAGR